MPGLVPGIHALLSWLQHKTWMAGTSPAMTNQFRSLSPSQPFRDALLRIGARFRVGTNMALLRQACVGAAPDRVQRKVRAVEIVIGAGIDHDLRQRAAPARPVDHLTAGRRRADSVFGADQQKRRDARAPSWSGRNPAVRIKGNR